MGDEERERIGHIPQQLKRYPDLNVVENLHFHGSIYGLSRRNRKAQKKALPEVIELAEAV